MALLTSSAALAQTTRPVTEADPAAAIATMRNELIDSFNKADMPRLLSNLDADVVVTWQNGEVSRGPDGVKAYYDKMMTGTNRIVESVHADPKVTDRHVYGDWAVSWGEMNDTFKLTDGRELPLNSHFTATIARRGDAWKVTSFHLSVDAFDNPILKLAVGKAALWTGIGVGALSLIVGVVIGRIWGRKAA